MIKSLNITEVEYIPFSLARELLSFNEPIPDFSSRFPNILESSLIVPFQKFQKKFLYKGLIQKAAILFYLIIKNHPFQNGNKRIAMTTLFYFLYKNKKWLRVDNKELYDFAVWVTESNPKLKKSVIKAIEEFLEKNIVELK